MRKLVLLGMVLTLAGCGLSEDERADYIEELNDARIACQRGERARCGDVQQLELALAENKRLEDY